MQHVPLENGKIALYPRTGDEQHRVSVAAHAARMSGTDTGTLDGMAVRFDLGNRRAVLDTDLDAFWIAHNHFGEVCAGRGGAC